MIKQLKLTNWKSFGEATLYIDPLTILIGTNASGKSNVLDALAFLRGITHGESIGSVLADEPGSGGDWVIRQGESYARIELITSVPDNSNGEWHYSIELKREDKSRIGIAAERLSLVEIEVNTGNTSQHNLFNFEFSESTAAVFNMIEVKKDVYRNIVIRGNVSALSQFATFPMTDAWDVTIEHIVTDIHAILILDPVPVSMRSYSKISESLLSNGANTAGVLAALPATAQSSYWKT